jgi:uncharacterized protein (DUF305 family)
MRHALLSASTLGASTRQRMPSAVRHLTIVIGLGIALPACSSKDAAKTDSSAAATPVAAPAGAPAADTSAHAAATGMGNMAMTGNPDQDFLRMMSDHHKGLIAMVHLTVESKDKITTKPIAARLDKAQDAELDKMVTMLEKDFKDPYAPKMMPDNQAMLDELKGKTGAEFDKTFLTNIIKHHEGALKMIDEYLPKAKSPAIKAMAEKMKAVQSKEIAEFQAKLAK